MKYRYFDYPRPVELTSYANTINHTVDHLKEQKGITSIYQLGHTNHPGISDIDLIVIFSDDQTNLCDPHIQFDTMAKYLFTHRINAINRSNFLNINKFGVVHNLKLRWGEQINLKVSDQDPSEAASLKRQIALEFLIYIFISLTIQKRYGSIKLRSLLQHAKSVRFDLELLGVTSGTLYELHGQLMSYLDNWFTSPFDAKEFSRWLDRFYKALQEFTKSSLMDKGIYVPEYARSRISRTTTLIPGKELRTEFRGITLPAVISGINKKLFNLNSRLGRFIFAFPQSPETDHDLLKERYLFYRNVKGHTQEHFPNFAPAIAAFVDKVL